jgi:beta-N-acetylhexosaminidase
VSSRLFGVGIAGTELSDAERETFAAHPPYGVILFRRNIDSLSQLENLVGELREAEAGFLFLDQEGGPVDRLRDVLAPSPSLQRAARLGLARGAGDLAGAALRSLGFDADLAPVVDRGLPAAGALVLGERSASEHPAAVERAAAEFLAGLHAAGIGGCLKHFPGLGRAKLDTHRSLPVLEADPHEEALDLSPFAALMEKARAVMISHAAGPDGVPASLSEAAATGILRLRLGFTGAAFSDDLEMGALEAFGDLPERCARAAAAGCDLLFVCRRIEDYPACVEAVERLVPEARRSEAAGRLEDYSAHLSALRHAAAPQETSVASLVERIRGFGEV